jgi:hypothetical protein
LKNLIYIFIITSLFSVKAEASLLNNIKEGLRPSIEFILGKDIARSLLGDESGQIRMPKIPQINTNAKSVSGLNDKPRVSVSFSEDQLNRYNYIFIQEIIRAVREVDAGAEEISRWMNVLNQSGSREGIYSGLVLDNTYMGLQNLERLASQSVIDFTIGYLEKYIDKSMSADKLAKVNFYVVKREIAERTLIVLDGLFKQEGEGIYDWYALFSQELAQNYPEVMDNEVRKVTDALAHKAWAKSVPDQFVKSEVLIKLHRVFNKLQSQPQ